MPRLLFLATLYFLILQSLLSQDTTIYYLNDGFETTPRQWVSQPSVPFHPEVYWTYRNGAASGVPLSAYEGSYNAYLYYSSFQPYNCRLVSSAIDLSTAIKPQLTFYHTQALSSDGNDKLTVLFKAGASGTWDTIAQYIANVESWTKRTFNIEEYGSKYLTSQFYVAFSGNVIGGHGICIDNVKIEEKGIIPRYIYSVDALNVDHPLIPTGVKDIPLFRINIEVIGNTNTIILDSIKIKSLSSDNNVFESNAFSLFYTRDDIFMNKYKGVSTKIGTDQSISNGYIKFNNLNLSLKTGQHCFWLVADIKSTAPHNSIVDFMLDANSIFVSGNAYPNSAISPSGNNIIEESVFFDDFETDKGWTINYDFERDVPKGKFVIINSDPDFAYSGDKIIGTDLNEDGAYRLSIDSANAYYATTPTINLKYFDRVKLSLFKWNTIETQDKGSIDISIDGGTTWTSVWQSQIHGQLPEYTWNNLYIFNEINSIVKRQPNVKFRIGINYSDDNNAYAGWNIDNFAVTGEYLTNDVGITDILLPCDDCINTGYDTVRVVVKNYAAVPTPSNLRLFYSLSGSQGTKVYDTITTPIPPDGSLVFTFTRPANFPSAGVYHFLVSTDSPGDQDRSNDSIYNSILIQENISPPHTVNFETCNGYWKSGGIYNTWECKVPDLSIGSVPGSPIAWVLSPYGNYSDNDSSFIISSCYNLIGDERLVLENKYWMLSEQGNDGANVQYTTNDGITWTVLTKNTFGYPWEWYENYVTSLENIGWSGNSNGWKTAKTILPLSLNSQSRVKFRVLWQSDADSSNRGLAFDDFKIYPAPYDIGVTAINGFATRCEGLNPQEVTVSIKNYGLNALKTNDTIIVGFDFNNTRIAIDTFRLAAPLLPNQTIQHTFSEKITNLLPASYNIRAYTLIEKDPFFYGTNNDTFSVSFNVLPNPTIGLPDTIQTKEPDTVVLRPYYHPDYDYLWQDGKTTVNYDVDKGGLYTVTVTATRGNGCSAKDSTYVELLFYDVGVDSLIHPANHCGLSTQEYITLRIKNYGTDSIPAGQKMKAAFVLNNGAPVIDTFYLTNTLYSKHSLIHTFTVGPVNLSAKGIYNFKLYADYSGDTVNYNDTIVRSVEMYGYPTANLGPDRTIQALQYELDAGTGYIDYLWDNGATTQKRTIDETGTYWVWVLDNNNCSDFDTVYIRLKIRDISPQLQNPISACTFNPNETVRMRIVNTGTDTVPAGETVEVRYKLNSGGWVTGSFVLTNEILPAASVTHNFPGTVNLNSQGDYIFTLVAKTPTDIRVSNDTLVDTVYRYPKPVVDFGLGTTYTVRASEFTIDAGYHPYYNYLWQDNSTQYYYNATNSGTYYVKATDSRTGCFGGDTVILFLIIDDLGVTGSSLASQLCSGSYENVQVTVRNLGTTSIGVGERIYVGYDVNGIRISVDTLVLDRVFTFGTTRTITLKKPITINASPAPVLDFYTLLSADMRPYNDTLTVTPEVLPSPVVDFGDVNGILRVPLPHILDAGSGHKSYLWNNGSTAQTLTVTANGTYSVTVTGQNDCRTTKVVQINPNVGFNDITDNLIDVTVYPNPSNGEFNLNINMENPETLYLSIINLSGRVVYNQQIFMPQSQATVPLDLKEFPAGIYQMLLRGKDTVYKAKIMIY